MSAMGLKIERSEIEKALCVLLDRTFGERSSIELSNEYYWAVVPSVAAFDMDAVPEPTIGQLSHDVERIQEVVSDPDLVVGYALTFLAPVLAAIGFERPE